MALSTIKLPLELWSEITPNVISKKDLFQLRSVNSLFDTLATPEIFRSITVRNDIESAERFWTILNTPHVAQHVQSIKFFEERRISERHARKRIEAAFSILHHTPHLKALELYFNAYYVEFEAVSYVRTQNHSHQWDIVYALGSNRNPLPELQTLIFSGWAVAPEFASLFDEAPIAWLTTSLRHLKFSLPKGCEGTYTWEERKLYWKQVVVPRVLQPAANLESFEVTGYQHGQGSLWPEEQYLDISQLPTYPRLAALSLKNIIWEGTIGERNIATPSPLEDFIVHHSKTLKKLELHNCLILVDNRSGPPPFYCADIYTHLAKALTNLVDLEVSLDIERYEIPYATGRSYDSLTSLVGKERDALALEEFKTTVKNRGIGGFDREAN